MEHDLESFGLTGPEARALVALIRLGAGSAGEVARASAIHRTSAHQTLDSLCRKGLAEPLPGKVGVWTSLGRDEVLNRLYALHEERLRVIQTRMEHTRRLLADIAPEPSSPSLAQVHLLRGAAQVEKTYEQLLSGARRELVVFNRPPYGFATTVVNDCVLGMLARGIDTRVLYRSSELRADDAGPFLDETARYIRLGMSAGVVDELPLKMAVVDQGTALVTLVEPGDGVGFPTTLLVTSEGFAAALHATFEHYWQEAESVAGLLGLGAPGI